MGLRLVFLGTGRLALPVFQDLCDSEHTVCGLVTQPDRTGSGHHRHVNPLKELAIARGIPVLQPVKIRLAESVAALRELQADLFVVAAYGQILSRDILDMPRLGTINVHASILPKYRGATPIHAAVLQGDVEAGVSMIRLIPELDAGPILGIARLNVLRKETTGELEGRLAELARPLTLSVIRQLEEGTARFEEQDHSQSTHVGKLTKEDGRIRWDRPAVEVERHIRGMQPWPGPFTALRQTDKPPLRMQVLDVEPVFCEAPVSPGTVVSVAADRFVVRTSDAAVEVLKVHPDGKRPLTAAEFLRGRKVQPGDSCE